MHAGREGILPPFFRSHLGRPFSPRETDFPRGRRCGEDDAGAQRDRAAASGRINLSLLGEQLDQASYLFDGLDGSDYDDYADE